MSFIILLKGIFIGLAVAIPIGPVGILCIDRTLAHGKKSGLMSGFGAAAADGVFAAIASYSVDFVSEILIPYQHWIRLFGSLFLIFFGIKIFIEIPSKKGIHTKGKDFFADFISTFFLTLTNPTTIMAFLMIFAAIGLKKIFFHPIAAGFIVAGIIIGSVIWWTLVCEIANRFQKKMTIEKIMMVNKVTGALVVAFGIVMIISALAFLTKNGIL